MKFINARSYLRGIIIRPYWKSLEIDRGTYNFSLIDQAIKELNSGKYVWVQLQTAIFNNAAADANSLLPNYLTTAEFDGGAYDDGTHVKTKVWNAAVIGRKIELMKALAAKYNNAEKFEGVLTGETAMSLTTNEGTSGYSPAALTTQLSHLMISARKVFTKKKSDDLRQFYKWVRWK